MFKYRSLRKYKYQLIEAYQIQTGIIPERNIYTDFIDLSDTGTLSIKSLYAWDGASGAIDTDTIMEASLVHDAFCQLIAEGRLDKSYRKQADKLLRDLCIINGMCALRAWSVYHAVRLFVKVKYK